MTGFVWGPLSFNSASGNGTTVGPWMGVASSGAHCRSILPLAMERRWVPGWGSLRLGPIVVQFCLWQWNDGGSWMGVAILWGSECGDYPCLWPIVVQFCLWQWNDGGSWMGGRRAVDLRNSISMAFVRHEGPTQTGQCLPAALPFRKSPERRLNSP